MLFFDWTKDHYQCQLKGDNENFQKLGIIMLAIGYMAAAPSPVDSSACIFNFTDFSSSNLKCVFPFSIVLSFSLLGTTQIKL